MMSRVQTSLLQRVLHTKLKKMHLSKLVGVLKRKAAMTHYIYSNSDSIQDPFPEYLDTSTTGVFRSRS
jgi:hypothetical protein